MTGPPGSPPFSGRPIRPGRPKAAATSDLTGDGVDDLVVGAGPYQTSRRRPEQGGSIMLVPGGSGEPRLFSQDEPGSVLGTGEPGDDFGAGLARGDFDGDRRLDLAVGVPGEDVGPSEDAGAVAILRGGRRGLVPNGGFTQNTPGVSGKAEAGDGFGSDLAAGDFDGDGYDDLAVGVPGEGLGKSPGAGMVALFRGGPGGLRPGRSLSQRTPGITGGPDASDFFGTALASGDVTGDGIADLVVTADHERLKTARSATGIVHLIPGGRGGLVPRASSAASVERLAVSGVMGDAVTVGRFHGGPYADVAVYAERARGAKENSGAVVELRGGPDGISAARSRVIHQGTKGVPGSGARGDVFGGALSAADLDGDRHDELIVGAHAKNGGAGAVWVLSGVRRGLEGRTAVASGADGALRTAAHSGWARMVAPGGGMFGIAVTSADRDADGRREVVVSAPGSGPGLYSFTFAGPGSRIRPVPLRYPAVSQYGPSAPLLGGSTAFLPSSEP
ncbi:FG-GAP repeat protein [Bailinhaonella thermotolerans]|uniref:VCBS repeat-containing protein n=1 Tax=Bailinhaonella thermotolerans TaxID=1070861 RepID=A0A3A4B295_9ACTN|nr:FG-GAP repeat protein [Bailinhaonella thermotolerans]RJL32127.1 hypothetical protein D5H75_17085 [Bailinhaonella thermotolerans]